MIKYENYIIIMIAKGFKRTIFTSRVLYQQRQTRFHYLTPVDKPITSLAVNSMIELSAHTLQYLSLESGLPSELSVLLGSFAFRMTIEFLGYFFKVGF